MLLKVKKLQWDTQQAVQTEWHILQRTNWCSCCGSAFNHPFNLAVHQVIPAIAVGCSVIIKPATQTPMSAIRLIEILKEAGLPNGWAQAVVCGREAGETLATSPKVNFLTFIGSGAVGWYLNSKVANGTRVA